MANLIIGGRSFDYDVRSLLGIDTYPPVVPPPDGQIVMTISGLPGTVGTGTWNGLGNGVHGLAGVETLTATEHRWTYDSGGGSDLLLLEHRTYSGSSYTFNNGRVYYHSNTAGIMNRHSHTGVFIPSINDTVAGTIGAPVTGEVLGVTFTWFKGNQWDRGNM